MRKFTNSCPLGILMLTGVLLCGGRPAWAADESDGGESSAPPASQSAGSTASGQKEKRPARPRYEFRKKHDRDGIGKFYMGREIAHVMGYAGIDWLERPERESEEHLTQLVESLKLTPGMVVADIGAGSGLISVMMSKKVGATGTVLAVDIQDEMLSVLSKRMKQLKITNVKPVRGTEQSPQLKAGSVDLALMVDVYHEFRYPYEMLSEIAKALKPNGRVVFVEFRLEDPNVPIKLLHKMTEAQVKREAGRPELGLRWVETIAVLPRQHVIIFEKR
jgi:precorrin-6B methylase 2